MMPGVLFPGKPHGFALTYLTCLTYLYTGMFNSLIHGRAAPLITVLFPALRSLQDQYQHFEFT